MNTENKNARTFDVIIPVGPNDLTQFKKVVSYINKNVIGFDKIYLITTSPSIKCRGCITIFEGDYSFSTKDIESLFKTKTPRVGWYLQQLLKLYAPKAIKDLKEDFLVIDSDTFFLRPTEFFKEGKPLFNYGTENHKPYFTHMNKLLPNLGRVISDKSGVCHYMMFNSKKLNDLFNRVEKLHKMPFWQVFILSVDKKEINFSGASEYEIYFNFLLKYHPSYIKLRPLKWINTYELPFDLEGYDYASIHYYIRNKLSKFKKFRKRVKRLIKALFSYFC